MHNIYIYLYSPSDTYIHIHKREEHLLLHISISCSKENGQPVRMGCLLSSFDKVPTPTLNIALFLPLICFGAEELVIQSYKPTFFIKC